jgi:aminoglycoside phosphotransferase (APT) family kinase protein
MEREELRGKIAAHVARQTGGTVEVRALEPLAGGACQDNWRVELTLAGGELPGDRKLVMRSDSKTSLAGSIDRAAELKVVQAAVRAGVRTPEARWGARDLTRPGATSYFLDWANGEAIGRRVVKSPQLEAARAKLPGELGRELGRIHSITPANEPGLFADDGRAEPVTRRLAALRQMVDALPGPRPALELALRWLEDHKPPASEVTLVHGDFRVGNFLVTPEGLTAVLDWEFAHWGTPAEDLAWICVRDWRFGKLDLPVGGIAKRETFYRAYEEASGRRVDPREVRFHEVMGNVGWALGSLQQGERYRAGDHDLELIAVARRACEMEYEALRLIEREA